VPYGPATLPFLQPPAKPATAVAGVVNPYRPARTWKARTPEIRYRQRVRLVAAAVLLLALGITLPQAGGLVPQAGQSGAMPPPMGLRGEAPLQLVLGGVRGEDAEKVISRSRDAREISQRLERVDELGARINASVQTLEKQGKKPQAESLARQYASNLTR